jgi:hypothetical protein
LIVATTFSPMRILSSAVTALLVVLPPKTAAAAAAASMISFSLREEIWSYVPPRYYYYYYYLESHDRSWSVASTAERSEQQADYGNGRRERENERDCVALEQTKQNGCGWRDEGSTKLFILTKTLVLFAEKVLWVTGWRSSAIIFFYIYPLALRTPAAHKVWPQRIAMSDLGVRDSFQIS